MASKRRRRTFALDATLALLAVMQMLRGYLPDVIHQAGGVAFGALLAIHLAQHRKQLKRLGRGRGPIPPVNLAITLGVAFCAVAMVASGIAMTAPASVLRMDSASAAHITSVAREIHLLVVHAGFLLLGAHAGFSIRAKRNVSRVPQLVETFVVSLFGIHSLADLDFVGYLTGSIPFAFIDATKPTVLAFVQYASIFASCALLGHQLRHELQRLS